MLCEAWHQERLRLKCTPQLQVLRGETVWVTATSSVKLTILPNLRGKNGLMKGKEPTEYEEPVRSDGQMWRLKKVSGLLWTEHLHTHSVLELIWIDSVKTAGLIRSKCLRKTMRKLEEADWKPQNQVTSVATGWTSSSCNVAQRNQIFRTHLQSKTTFRLILIQRVQSIWEWQNTLSRLTYLKYIWKILVTVFQYCHNLHRW